MRNISAWAAHHPWTARFLILACYLGLNLTGLVLGDLLQSMECNLSISWTYVILLVVCCAFALYPTEGRGHNYRRRKRLDGLLIACTFLLVTGTGNRIAGPAAALPWSAPALATPAAIAEKPGKPLIKKDRKKVKQFIRQARAKYRNMPTGLKVLLIVAAVGSALALAYGVALLACSVMCSGAEALGYVILFLGWAAIIFFLVRTIRRIIRGPRRKVESSGTT